MSAYGLGSRLKLLAPAFVVAAAVLLQGASAQQDSITVWHYFSVDSQVQYMEELAALFNETHPDVEVDLVFVPYDQLNNRVVASAVAGTGPDIIAFNPPGIGQLVSAGALHDMTAYWESFEEREQFSGGVVHRVDGSIYGVQGYVNLLGLWYNQDILDEIGVKPPQTVDELTAAMEEAVAAGYTGITLTGLSNDQGEWQAYPWMSGFGWNYENPDAAACEGSFSLAASWVDSGALSPIAATWGQAEPFQAFLVGDVAFAENGNWQLGAAQDEANFEYGVVPMPAGPESTQVYLGGEAVAIGAFSENPDLAWEFLQKTYYSVEGQLLAVELVGSIPARVDAAQDPMVTENALLEPFATSVQEMGTVYPPAVGPINQVRNAQLVVGQQWSAVIAGQSDAAACEAAVSGVNGELSD